MQTELFYLIIALFTLICVYAIVTIIDARRLGRETNQRLLREVEYRYNKRLQQARITGYNRGEGKY